MVVEQEENILKIYYNLELKIEINDMIQTTQEKLGSKLFLTKYTKSASLESDQQMTVHIAIHLVEIFILCVKAIDLCNHKCKNFYLQEDIN